MRYLIQILDGQPVNHPIAEENFREAFPGVDLDAPLPSWVAWFTRTDPQNLPVGVYEHQIEAYGWEDGVVVDLWPNIPYTPEEKAEKIALVVAADHPDGWVFDEDRCRWLPDLFIPGSAPDVEG
jgi:hypothetical protein